MNPSDFYFGVGFDGFTACIIVHKEYWNDNHMLDDRFPGAELFDNDFMAMHNQKLFDRLLPEGVKECAQSTYEYSGTKDQLKELLIAAGFEELPELNF